MACPDQGILNKTLTFTVRAIDINGEPVDADSIPTFNVYQTTTDYPIAEYQNISMVKSTVSPGLYYGVIFLSQDYFLENYSYIIDISSIVDGEEVFQSYTFVTLGAASYTSSSYIPETGDIRAVTDKKGRFRQDDWGIFLLAITNNVGEPVDAEEISIEIYQGTERVEFDSNIPVQVDNGRYVFEWVVDAEQPTGEYSITWMFTIDNIDHIISQNVIIHPGETTASADILYNERLIAFREGLEKLLICAQQIPVYFEQAKPSFDRRTFSFSFGRWNQSSRVKIYRNKKIINEGITINYFKGTVTFDERLLPQDVINADYDFRWFSDDEIDLFLNNAVMAFNSFPPAGNYTLLNVPSMYVSAILYGAAKDALRQLMSCLLFQEPQMVFGGPEQAQNTFGNIETLKQNYEKDWDKFTEVKKYGKYPKSAVMIVPEYTLPGGRSRWFRYLFK